MTAPDPRTDLGYSAHIAGTEVTITITAKLNGSPLDLTTVGSTWAAEARQKAASSTSEAFTVDASGAASGVIVLTLTADQTATMVTAAGDESTWIFDVELTGGAVSPQYPFKGTLQIKRAYTHG